MKELIACCGINCENCEARIATLLNDDQMRREVAAKWSEMFHASYLTPEMINCTGCRVKGAKFSHCETTCNIRKCVRSKGYSSCADCMEIDDCPIVGEIFRVVPDARENLRNLLN